MRILTSLIFLIVITLVGFVLKDSLLSIDIAQTKNNALQREYLIKVHEIKNVDSLYLEIEKQMDFRKQDRLKQSIKAINDSKLLGIALILIIIDMIIILIKKKNAT